MSQSGSITKTIGIVYGGEMGAAIAMVLRARGLSVVTTCADRSMHTARRSRESGMEVLPKFEDVVRESDIVMSLVSPDAADEVAEQYAQVASIIPKGAVYVDLNSIRPELAKEMGLKIARAGATFVDAAINGLAKNLTSSATLYVSGPRAADIAGLFSGNVRTNVLGDEIGRAKAIKMLLAGLSKGVCALFAELGLLAEQQGMLEELIKATGIIYPGISSLADRMLPTYSQHAARRATEMSELEQTMRGAGLEPCLIAAIRTMHDKIAGVSFNTSLDASGVSVASLIRQLASSDCLAGEAGEKANA